MCAWKESVPHRTQRVGKWRKLNKNKNKIFTFSRSFVCSLARKSFSYRCTNWLQPNRCSACGVSVSNASDVLAIFKFSNRVWIFASSSVLCTLVDGTLVLCVCTSPCKLYMYFYRSHSIATVLPRLPLSGKMFPTFFFFYSPFSFRLILCSYTRIFLWFMNHLVNYASYFWSR